VERDLARSHTEETVLHHPDHPLHGGGRSSLHQECHHDQWAIQVFWKVFLFYSSIQHIKSKFGKGLEIEVKTKIPDLNDIQQI